MGFDSHYLAHDISILFSLQNLIEQHNRFLSLHWAIDINLFLYDNYVVMEIIVCFVTIYMKFVCTNMYLNTFFKKE